MRSHLARPVMVGAVLLLLLLSVPAQATEALHQALISTWTRTDQPVADGTVSRTWIWGPLSTAWPETEPYVEGVDGEREVLYFDKSRMEITDPNADSGSIWFVTNGLLVMELVSGRLQLGHNSFEDHEPAQVNVAGDPDDPDGPTYASFRSVLDGTAGHQEEAIRRAIRRDGSTWGHDRFAAYGIGTAVFVPQTQHWVAEPFWEFMNATGLVMEGSDLVTERLFEDPYYGTGYPIADAFWAEARVAGVQQDVLIQCFQRRCLTYTPGNDPAWRVEAGNVGRHYYRWRYGHDIPGTETATGYMVAVGDDGASGIPVGCQDSLIPVTIPIWETESLEERIAATLTVLLSYDDEFHGESGLLNALHRNDAEVEMVDIVDGVATVNVTGTIPVGGVCDEPRVVGQLEQTVLAFDGVDEAVILLNGGPIFPPQGP